MTKQYHDTVLSADALGQLFLDARSYNAWLDKPVSDAQIEAIYDLMKMAPTSANMQPVRIAWVKSAEAKEKLATFAMPANQPKITGAPVVAIVGHDLDFHEELPWLFPHTDAKAWFAGNEDFRQVSAFRNGSLQGAYLMLAARALGLDCGPMSGFSNEAVDAAFFAANPAFGPRVKSNFICSIGYGDPSSVFDRSPRPDFAKFNAIV